MGISEIGIEIERIYNEKNNFDPAEKRGICPI